MITVQDTTLPVITCPANITVNNDPGTCGAFVTYTAPIGTDNCPGATTAQTGGLGSGSTFQIGTTTETYTVTDASGNSASCSFDVTVNDTENPTITCPANITTNTDPGVCGAVVTYNITSSDNCPGEAINQTAGLTSGSVFPIGTTTNTFVVTDAAGNKASCSFDVTVVDNELPVISCNAPRTIIPPDAPISFTATATDNCGVTSVVIIDYDCFKFTKKGKRIDKTESCQVQVDGDTITILDSGGVDDHIEWTVRVTDVNGNVEEVTCGVYVVKKSK
jgi:hypothetical protein